MSSAAQEPRRWTLQTTFGSDGWATRAFNGHEIGRSESIPVIEAAAYDALLAERDALKAELDDQREAYRKTIEDECATDEKHCACVPFLRSEVKRISDECDEGRCPSAEHERLAAAALREKAEALHDRYRKATENWHKCWDCLYPTLVEHAPDCPAHPDFLTTSATESREAKGGTT